MCSVTIYNLCLNHWYTLGSKIFVAKIFVKFRLATNIFADENFSEENFGTENFSNFALHELIPKVCLYNAHINLHAMLGSVRIHLHALPRNANAMMHLKQCACITKIMSNDCTHCRAMHTLRAFIAQQNSVRSATFAKVCILTLIYIKYNTYF